MIVWSPDIDDDSLADFAEQATDIEGADGTSGDGAEETERLDQRVELSQGALP